MKVLCFSILATCVLVVSVYAADWCLAPDCCSLLPTGTILGNPNNFTRYYRCIGGTRYGYECLSALRPCFNIITNSCDARENVSYCVIEGPPTTEATIPTGETTATSDTTTTGGPVTPECTPGEVYNVPVPGDCSKYKICVFGELLPDEQTCLEGLKFDSHLGGCNLEEDVQCTQPTCNPAINDTIPHTKVCSSYWNCTLGFLSPAQCLPNQNFDAIELKCKPEDDAICGNVCPDEGIEFEAYEGDCSMYWLCVHSKPHLRECLGELEFDCVLKECAPAPIDVSCRCSNTTAVAPNFW